MKIGLILSSLLVGSTLILSACDSGDKNVTTILDGKATMVLPEGFVKMPKEMLEKKYPAVQRPQEAWYMESEGGKVTLGFSLTDKSVTEAQVPMVADAMKQQLSAYSPSVTNVTVNGKKMTRMEMVTPSADGNIYNMIQFSSREGKLIITVFNTAEDIKDLYLKAGKDALSTMNY